MSKQRSAGRKSAEQLGALVVDSKRVPVPSFVKLRADAVEFWDVYTSARIANEWRDVDLLTIGKLCNLDAEIAEQTEVLAKTGPVLMVKGKPKANPLIQYLAGLKNQQIQLMRSAAINRPQGDLRTLLGNGLKGKAIQGALSSDDGLLAK